MAAAAALLVAVMGERVEVVSERRWKTDASIALVDEMGPCMHGQGILASRAGHGVLCLEALSDIPANHTDVSSYVRTMHCGAARLPLHEQRCPKYTSITVICRPQCCLRARPRRGGGLLSVVASSPAAPRSHFHREFGGP